MTKSYRKNNNKLYKKSSKKTKSRKTKFRKTKSRKIKSRKTQFKKSKNSHSQFGGDGYYNDLTNIIIPGQPVRQSYSDCCPPAFQDGQVIKTDSGTPYCS